MSCFNVSRALFVRVLFACHGVLAIWRLYVVTENFWSWYLLGALVGLFFETLITVAKNHGKEWKWFCPSVFFYLGSVVPAIWFLELYEMNKRIEYRERGLEHNATEFLEDRNETDEELRVRLDDLGLDFSISLSLSSDLWLRVLEQFLLLMLIIGRWVLPKGAISHDQLSQLLLVYVGTAADIVEFYEAFSEEEVKYNRLLCYIILGIWSLSLMQFTLVLTATRARRDQVGLPMMHQEKESDGCCNPEMYGIMTSIVMQDLPFLCVRLMLIFKFEVVSYTNMFFTSKNSVVIILLIYRLIVVQAESRKRRKKKLETSAVPRISMNDINANGHKPMQGKQLRHPMSRSTPNVFQAVDNNTMGRYKKKSGGGFGPSKSSSSSLDINYTPDSGSMRKGQYEKNYKLNNKRRSVPGDR